MKTEHTKGKWEMVFEHYTRKPKNICTGVGIITDIGNGTYYEMICNSLLPNTDKEYIKQQVEIEGNMKLITAAPDLLEMLNSLVLSITAHPDYVSGEEGDEWHDLISLADDAIKKATN